MVPMFAKRLAKSSLGKLGYSLHDLRKNNDLKVFLPGHLKALLARLKINCVLDVGANVGEYGRMLRRIGYRGRIISMEPVTEVFAQLKASAAGDDGWLTLNTACGSQEETRAINVFSQSGLNSFLAPTSNITAINSGRIERTENVTIRRLDSLFPEAVRGLDHPRVFLKTDVQGLDIEVIRGAGECLSKVQGIQSEVSVIPLYLGTPDYLEFLTYCRKLSFEPSGFFPIFNSPASGHLVECDVVLIRRDWSEIENALAGPRPN